MRSVRFRAIDQDVDRLAKATLMLADRLIEVVERQAELEIRAFGVLRALKASADPAAPQQVVAELLAMQVGMLEQFLTERRS